MIALKMALFILGIIVVLAAMRSAVRMLVLSRGVRDPITGFVFMLMRRLFNFRTRWSKSYEELDSIFAYYAPVSLLMLPPTWLTIILLGFTLIFWAAGIESWSYAFTISGSSLLTLGFADPETLFQSILTMIEATIGLIMVALLIAYLPSMYAAFSRRETAVNLLEIRAGCPPSALEMIQRYYRNQGLDALHESWKVWEEWFAQVEESHTSLAALVFFRSAQPKHSWVTATGAVLDAASLSLSTLDIPWDAQAALCIRAGFLTLHRISDYFDLTYEHNPQFPKNQISVTREEYDEVYDQLSDAGIPVVVDREKAWRDFAGWRVNYDEALLALSRLTLAPKAPWSSDRA
ncbi:MAG: hypothetical protein BMS9Abin02_0574 [Anaerolineae bacterium]|nr:MAG: hypothetical protein BMS9Abin02_0574 [Anaerolineae bacterium]